MDITTGSSIPLLSIDRLSVAVAEKDRIGGGAGDLTLVDTLSLQVRPGERVALVGESGSGKSMTARSILRLDPYLRLSGSIRWKDQELVGAGERQLRRIRGKEISMIFQDPMTALDPMFTVGSILVAAVRAHQSVTKRRATEIALAALADAGIEDPRRRFDEYPFQLSGGLSQRAMIALALVNDPKIIVADEPTTALDVTVQAQILERLAALKRDRKVSIVLITHNLGVVASVADRMAVMYAGEIVETGAVEDIFGSPQHPYTFGLLGAVPRLNSPVDSLRPIPGRVPQPDEWSTGCAFAPRCDRRLEQCTTVRPILERRRVAEVRCHHPVD